MQEARTRPEVVGSGGHGQEAGGTVGGQVFLHLHVGAQHSGGNPMAIVEAESARATDLAPMDWPSGAGPGHVSKFKAVAQHELQGLCARPACARLCAHLEPAAPGA